MLLEDKTIDEIIEIIKGEDPENPIYDSSAERLNSLGYYLITDRELEDAKKIFELGIELYPESYNMYDSYGECLIKLKEYENAIASFKKVVHLNPASAIDYANIASNYRDMGDPEKAIRYYELALAIDPSIEFAKENPNEGLERLVRERQNSEANFTIARSGDFFSNITIWEGDGREHPRRPDRSRGPGVAGAPGRRDPATWPPADRCAGLHGVRQSAQRRRMASTHFLRSGRSATFPAGCERADAAEPAGSPALCNAGGPCLRSFFAGERRPPFSQ